MTAIDWDNELHDPAWVTDREVHSGVMWGPNVLADIKEFYTNPRNGSLWVKAVFDTPKDGPQVHHVPAFLLDVWITHEDSWYDDFD